MGINSWLPMQPDQRPSNGWLALPCPPCLAWPFAFHAMLKSRFIMPAQVHAAMDVPMSVSGLSVRLQTVYCRYSSRWVLTTTIAVRAHQRWMHHLSLLPVYWRIAASASWPVVIRVKVGHLEPGTTHNSIFLSHAVISLAGKSQATTPDFPVSRHNLGTW